MSDVVPAWRYDRLAEKLTERIASERDQAEKHRYWHERYDEAGSEVAKLATRVDVLRKAIQDHLDTFGYDNHEGLADALAAIEEEG